MASDNFLQGFAAMLANVARDATVAKAWDRLLPMVCAHAGGDWNAGGLWLIDQDGGEKRLTLWHWWRKDYSGPKPENVSLLLSEGATLVGLVDRACLQLCHDGFLPPEYRSHTTTLSVPGEGNDGVRRALGALTLFSQASDPLPADFARDMEITGGLVASWMRLNREWRKSKAVAEFQAGQSREGDIAELADCAAQQLQTYASARLAAAVYVPEGGMLTRIGYRGLHKSPLQPGLESAIHRFHFEQEPDWPDDIVQIEFTPAGESPGTDETLADFPEVDPGGKPIAVVMARIRDGNGNGAGQGPVIASIMMATRAEPDFIGGRFSDTNRDVLKLIKAAFRDSYCLELQRDRMEKITRMVDELAKERATVKVMSEENDPIDFSPYVRMACNWLPSVVDAAIADSGTPEFWLRVETPQPKPNWVTDKGAARAPISVPGQPNRWHWEKKIGTGQGQPDLRLHLLLSTPQLPHIEQTLLDRIIAEARIEQHLHVNRDDWADQLAEVRHNMRAVLGSVMGKAKLISERYEAVIHLDREIVYDRLINQGQFRKNIRLLAHATSELETIFENIRALVGRLDADSLQITNFDLPDLVRNTVNILELEAERRHLQFIFINRMTSETRTVVGDPIWTRIALFNLLENAIKYSQGGSRNRDAPAIEVRLEVRGPYWQLRVTNSGRYIPPDMQTAIFEPYTRVRAKPGIQAMPGTGLGLMTVKRYADLHQNPGVRSPDGRLPVAVSSVPLRTDNTGTVTHARTSFLISIPRRGPGRDG